ncbi:hypothetical protein LINGRAHAP2_LOCUS10312 [Linum grandiflorum]
MRLGGLPMAESDWVLFQAWVGKSWGSTMEERRPLADDLWLIKLLTIEDVARIMRLGRWIFRDRVIDADGWFHYAGRSRVDFEQGRVWIRIDGIPLHLRSIELFRQMGNFCGGFLDFDEGGCSWNSVRIKIKQDGALPSQIPLCFENKCYSVQVM